MAEKVKQTRNRAQVKDEEETNLLLKEMKVIPVKVDNIEKQLNSKVDGLYVSPEKILKVELKKCVKDIQDNIDWKSAHLCRAWISWRRKFIQTTPALQTNPTLM